MLLIKGFLLIGSPSDTHFQRNARTHEGNGADLGFIWESIKTGN